MGNLDASLGEAERLYRQMRSLADRGDVDGKNEIVRLRSRYAMLMLEILQAMKGEAKLAGDDLVVHVLMARIEPAGMTDHADEAGFLLLLLHGLGIGPGIGQGDFHLHMLARVHAGDRLIGMHLRRRAQDHRIDVVALERFG